MGCGLDLVAGRDWRAACFGLFMGMLPNWWTEGAPELDFDALAPFARLRQCDTDARRALPVFIDGLNHPDIRVRAVCVFGAALFGRDDSMLRRRILAAAPQPTARRA